MKRIALVSGTRPEVVKLAPIYLYATQQCSERPVWISTGQHADMAGEMERAFGIAPDHNLSVMAKDQSLATLSARLIERSYAIFNETLPEIVVVQGDTTTVLCAALAAFYLKIPVAHVEAGLRTYDLSSPWPEEGNRRLVAQIATWHFCPTETSRRNLLSESINAEQCFVTGNTSIDALLYMHAKTSSRVDSYLGGLQASGIPQDIFLGECGSEPKPFIMITMHRRESFGSGFEEICDAIVRLANRYPDIRFLYPVHLNPGVRDVVFRRLMGLANVVLVEPLSYVQFIILMARCLLVMTDSGGIQEEAPSLGKPVIVLREKTERPEGVEVGASILCGTSAEKIFQEVSRLVDSPAEYRRHVVSANPYGDGQAAQRILNVLREL